MTGEEDLRVAVCARESLDGVNRVAAGGAAGGSDTAAGASAAPDAAEELVESVTDLELQAPQNEAAAAIANVERIMLLSHLPAEFQESVRRRIRPTRRATCSHHWTMVLSAFAARAPSRQLSGTSTASWWQRQCSCTPTGAGAALSAPGDDSPCTAIGTWTFDEDFPVARAQE